MYELLHTECSKTGIMARSKTKR